MSVGHWNRKQWLNTKEFPGKTFPAVLCLGQPSFMINGWIAYLMDEKMKPNVLDYHVRAIRHLHAFTMSRFGANLDKSQYESLIADFIDAKRSGTGTLAKDDAPEWAKSLELNWEPTAVDNIQNRYLMPINRFDVWQTTYFDAKQLNPFEKRFHSAWEIYSDFKRREDWDELLHLHGTREHSSEENKSNAKKKYEGRSFTHKVKTKKSFPLQHFIDFIDLAENPRDKIVLLTYAGGASRRSEPLHFFHSDIDGYDEKGQILVRLADPVTGMVEWVDELGVLQSDTREHYFERCWSNDLLALDHPLRGLQPRVRYNKPNSGLHSGFKGMTFHDCDSTDALLGFMHNGRPYDANHMFWIDPRIASYFELCYEEYVNKYIRTNPHEGGRKNPKGWPYHPFLLIKIEKEDYGQPLTITAIKGIWARLKKRAEKRLGIRFPKRLGVHSLRHMFAYYCANVLEIPPHLLQVYMHHHNIQSTMVYYALSSKKAREAITKAQLKLAGLEYLVDALNDNKKPGLIFPDHWLTNEVKRRMALAKAKNLQLLHTVKS